MATIKCFKDLKCWMAARALCKTLGSLIDSGRFKNNYRLIGQMEGSSGSITDNIAEGFERGTRAEFIQFLGYAKGSGGELRSQLYRAFDRDILTNTELEELKRMVIQINSQLQKLISYLQQSEVQGVRKKSSPKQP